MGKQLTDYLNQNKGQLESIALGTPQRNGPGMLQEGSMTFPAPASNMPQVVQSFGQQPPPRGPMPGATPTFAPPTAPQAAPVPTFQPQQQAAPQPGQQPKQGMSDEYSFDAMMKKAKDKDVEAAIGVIEQSGVDIDQAYMNATGQPPAKGMSRKEKGQLLMEFGLNLMAQSGTGEGTLGGDIGKAGLGAMQSYRQQQANKAQSQVAQRDEQRKEKELEIKGKVADSQIAKNKKGSSEIKRDGDGNLIVINKQTGEASPILMGGKPVSAGPDEKRLEFEIKRDAFKAAYAGNDSEEKLNRRAVAFANSIPDIAFPELNRQKLARGIAMELNKVDNSSAKYTVNGEAKRWKDMSQMEMRQVLNNMVDLIQSTPEKMAASAKFDPSTISSEVLKTMEPGKIYTLNNGAKVRVRNGKAELVE